VIDILGTFKKGYKQQMLDLQKIITDPVLLGDNNVEWVKISANVKTEDLINCLDLNEIDCRSANKVCGWKEESGKCRYIFPKNNLMYDEEEEKNLKQNSELYKKKLADELIRYKKVREYVLKNDSFLNFETVEYKINDDEIIIIKNMLYQIYVNDIQHIEHSDYINNNSIYDNTNTKEDSKFIKKYENKLIISMDWNDNIYESEESDDDESDESSVKDQGVEESKTADKQAPKKKEGSPKKEEGSPKKKGKLPKSKGQEKIARYVIKEYLEKYHKGLKVGEFKKYDFIDLWRINYVKALNSKDNKLLTALRSLGYSLGNTRDEHGASEIQDAWQKQDIFKACSIVKNLSEEEKKRQMEIENEIKNDFNGEGVENWPEDAAYRHAWGHLLRKIIYHTKNPPDDNKLVFEIANNAYLQKKSGYSTEGFVKPYLKD